MTLKDTLAKLESLKNEKTYAHNAKLGAGDRQYGVKLGDIKALAKKIKINHPLAMELWKTKNIDARLLAVLILDPKQLSNKLLGELVSTEKFTQVADWLYAYVIKAYPDKESLRLEWENIKDVMASRAYWSLTSGRVASNSDGLDIPALLDRIETEMPKAAPEIQWTMNSTLAQIGITFSKHRKRALEIGEKLGIYRDFPVSKGCTSPFAPIWINEMVKRQK